MWPFKRRVPSRPDPEAFLADLRASARTERYSDIDRRRDFRQVFSGAGGKRVLYQIMDWGGMFDPRGEVPTDPDELQRWAGRRDLAADIMVALNAEVTPDEPIKTDEEDDG